MSLEEMAEVTGVGAETVKSRLRYATTRLRQALAAHAPRDVADGVAEGAADKEAR
jgi:DNA-directed RNA polymerase specialized sigma24 family protein